MINVGDICRVRKSNYLAAGSLVKILMEVQQGIFLCSNKASNTIVVAENLELVEGTK